MTRKKASKKRNRVNSGTSNHNDNIPKTAKNVITACDNQNIIKGLQNLGNTCYFNSMLQMILHSPSFMVKLKSYCESDYELIVKMSGQEVKLMLKSNEVSCVEKELIKLWEADCPTISPAGLRNALLKYDQFKVHFSGFNEQDSHEAFLMMLNIIKEAQIKRIKKAILDRYDCKTSIDKLTDDEKLEIKTLGNIAEKLTLLHSHFGIVVGSALKCDDCGEIRLRFDESLHISPIFPLKSETNDEAASKKQNNDDNNKVTVLVDKTVNSQSKKPSKHQLKKQKRIERKANRNKKAILRNLECSPENEVMEIHDGDSIKETVNDSMIESESTNLNDVVVTSPENISVNPLMARFLGSTEENDISQEPVLTDFSCYDSGNKDMSSSNCSKAAIGSNSSRASLSEQSISQGDLEMLIDQEIIQKFTSVSIENDANEDDMKEISSVANSPFNKDESFIGNFQLLSNGDDNTSEQFISNEQNNSSEFPLLVERKNMQNVLNATLESHQEYLHSLNIDRVLFDTETDLDRAFNKFIAPLYIENLGCDSCSKSKSGAKTDHIKREIICHLPFILPIYISRFKQINAKNRNLKNNQIYSFPFLLNLSLQCSKYANIGGELSPVVYRLYGMIEHIGSKINSGHYVSYICRSRDPTSQEFRVPPQSYSSNILNDICKKHDQNYYLDHQTITDDTVEFTELENLNATNYNWYRISDSNVESVSNSAVLKCQAFMLFYTRVQ